MIIGIRSGVGITRDNILNVVGFGGGDGTRIGSTSVQSITTLSAAGDPVTTLRIINPVDGETYTWSLTDNAGGAVQLVDMPDPWLTWDGVLMTWDGAYLGWDHVVTKGVAVLDPSGVGLQTTFTVRATAAPSGDTFDRVITTPVAPLFALEIEIGLALEIESGHALEVA